MILEYEYVSTILNMEAIQIYLQSHRLSQVEISRCPYISSMSIVVTSLLVQSKDMKPLSHQNAVPLGNEPHSNVNENPSYQHRTDTQIALWFPHRTEASCWTSWEALNTIVLQEHGVLDLRHLNMLYLVATGLLALIKGTQGKMDDSTADSNAISR